MATTYQYQSKLPPLPIPDLDKTLKKYLKSLKPLLTSDDYKNTEKIVEDFGSSEVAQRYQKILQERVVQKAKENKSWLEEWWLKYAYLLYKDPLPITLNYWLHFDSDIVVEDTPWLLQAGRVIWNVAQVKQDLDNEQIQPEYMGDKPLDMNQMVPIFTCSRDPGIQQDSLDIRKSNWNAVVISNKQFYEMSLIHDGQLLSIYEIQLMLQNIWDDSLRSIPDFSPGVFTSWERTKWAKVRDQMIKNTSNRESFESIKNCAFVVVLDPSTPATVIDACHQLAMGDPHNRWFDKIFQLIFFRNGRAGINAEHTPLDAPALCKILDIALLNMRKQNQSGYPLLQSTRQNLPSPSKLHWNITPDLISNVRDAQADFQALVNDVDLMPFHYPLFGARFLKAHKVSPDGFVQLSLQLGYFKLHRRGCPVYETAQTRQFFHGRTSTVRSFCSESFAFSKIMCSDAPKEDKLAAMHVALKALRDYMTDCTNGCDVDRHLLGMRILALEEGIELPIFKDPAYSASCRYLLSTSNVPAAAFTGGFGNMYPDGYGIPYIIRGDIVKGNCVSRKSCPETNSKKFVESWGEALKEMAALLEPFPVSKL
eukprot:TRINITY_DN1480_c0_g1_i1.p1 TRINITY_DN1480_c0_g1~~TRINITY_DN1480_c0_g1_i1.p1  ORF type:complete len:594 (-),score=105.62 TRINITY_DN1480_c0_g1_i1:94-1875(-)